MGLFDLLSKEGREKSALARHLKKVVDKHAKTEDRFPAMEKLRENGSDEALYGLVRRFSYAYDKTIEDEQEKEWVTEALVAAGPAALRPVRRYLRDADRISHAVRVLEAIATPAEVLEVVDEIFAREEPGYTRDPSKRTQVLTWLGEWKGAPASEVAPRIVPYLADFDETVRFTAVEALAHQPDEASSRVPLLDALVREAEESRRIKVRIAEALAAAGWIVTDRKEQVSRLLATELPEFGMQHDKLLRKKG